jgi:hypothetical protein
MSLVEPCSKSDANSLSCSTPSPQPSKVDEACSMSVARPIIAQYYPGRKWLWRQWSNTIVRRTLPREVLWNVAFATALSLCVCAPGPTFPTTWIPYLPFNFAQGEALNGAARAWWKFWKVSVLLKLNMSKFTMLSLSGEFLAGRSRRPWRRLCFRSSSHRATGCGEQCIN